MLVVPLALVFAFSAGGSSDESVVAADPGSDVREDPESDYAMREAESEPESESKPKPNLKTESGRILAKLQEEEENGPSESSQDDSASHGACSDPDAKESYLTLKNASLFYRDRKDGEPRNEEKVNRAAGCLHETGRTTEFGFRDVIEGESFGMAKGAGDFVAYSTVMWVADDGTDDGFFVWNLRSGTEVPTGETCAFNEVIECSVKDIELTDRGSYAYSSCNSDRCHIFVKRDEDEKRSVADRLKYGRSPALLKKNGQLYWISDNDQLRSTPFT